MGIEGIRDRYINPYTDFGFKKLFGTNLNKDLLISFLNALLEGQETVDDVTYLNVEQLGSRELDRRAVFDVYCQNRQGDARTARANGSWWKCKKGNRSSSRIEACITLLSPFGSRPSAVNGITR